MGLKSYNSPRPHHPQTRPFASVAFLSLTDELDAHIIKQLLLALVVGIIWRVFPYYYYLSPARLRVSSSFEDTDVINTLQRANYQSPPVFCPKGKLPVSASFLSKGQITSLRQFSVQRANYQSPPVFCPKGKLPVSASFLSKGQITSLRQFSVQRANYQSPPVFCPKGKLPVSASFLSKGQITSLRQFSVQRANYQSPPVFCPKGKLPVSASFLSKGQITSLRQFSVGLTVVS